MNLYTPEGWLDVTKINTLDIPFVFVYGGRGIGKTYGQGKDIAETFRGKVVFLRRTATEYDIVTARELNTFNDFNRDSGHDIQFEKSKGFSLIVENGEEIGVCAALSTFSNLRGGGFDRYHPEILLYDEFIPEQHKSRIKNECDVLLNVYETINRNREIKGEKPLKLRCYANSNDIRNPIFLGLGLVTMAEKMRRKGKEIYVDRERGIALIDCINSPISKRKSETALYKLSRGSEFFNMAIKNEFASGLFGSVARPLIEYRPVVSIGEICIYQHKSRNTYYVSSTIQNSVPVYAANDTQIEMFRIHYGYLVDQYYLQNIEFESNITQLLFLTYLKIV